MGATARGRNMGFARGLLGLVSMPLLANLTPWLRPQLGNGIPCGTILKQSKVHVPFNTKVFFSVMPARWHSGAFCRPNGPQKGLSAAQTPLHRATSALHGGEGRGCHGDMMAMETWQNMGSTHNPLFMSRIVCVYIVWWIESSTLSRGDTQSPSILTPPPHLTYFGASNPRVIIVYDRK